MTKPDVVLKWISIQEMRRIMVETPALYGMPTLIAEDTFGRVFVWPLPYRIELR